MKAPSHESTKSFDGWICLWSSSTQPCSCDAISRNFSPRTSKFSNRTTSKTNIFFSSIQTTQSLVEIWRRADARSWKRDGGPVIWCQKYSNNCYHGLSSSNTKNSYATHTFCFVNLSISRWGRFWLTLDKWILTKLSVESSSTNWIDWKQCNVKKSEAVGQSSFLSTKKRPRQFSAKNWPSLTWCDRTRKFLQYLNSWW